MSSIGSAVQKLVSDFAFLDDWEDRYRYIIELGRALPDLPEHERTPENKVRGCASQVWLIGEMADDDEPLLHFRGDSDAHIVRGLIAILLSLYSGRTARDILDFDAERVLAEIGLREHLTAQRSNGLTSMVARIRADAEAVLEGALS
jgi:cysteine desulfuration protein SufE